MKFGAIRKHLLIFCLSASFVLHAGVLWFFFSNPFTMTEGESKTVMKGSPTPQVLAQEAEEILVEKIEKALEDSLNTVIALNHSYHDFEADRLEETAHLPPSSKQKEEEVAAVLEEEEKTPPILDILKEGFTSSMPPPFDPEREASLNDFALDDQLEENASFSYQSEKYSSVNLTTPEIYSTPCSPPLLQDDYSMTEDQFSPTALSLKQIAPHFIASLNKLKTPELLKKIEEVEIEEAFAEVAETPAPRLILPNSVDYLRDQWIKRSVAENKLPTIDYYGLETIPTAIDWEENIDVTISLMQEPEGNKYIFSLTLNPNFENSYEPMEQNFYFFIDHSNSVDKQKFLRFRRAVQRSLAALKEGDTFNIFVFDKKPVKLFEKNKAVTEKTIKLAEDFLEGQETKAPLSAPDLFTALQTIIPTKGEDMHTVVLITDGNTLFKGQNQKKLMEQLTKKQASNLNIYTAAAGKGNNLPLLDLVSYTTGGKLVYSDTNAAFARKLVKLVKDLHDPIARNLSIELTSKDPRANISLLPSNQPLPPLYADQPYTIIGTVDELCDFTLYLQAKNHDKVLNIHKLISLETADKGGKTLEKLWAGARSKNCYEDFLKNGKIAHLKEAKEIVTPYKGIISME